MVNTHEIDLSISDFEFLRNNSYIIRQIDSIEKQDYILFRQSDAGLFMMTQVMDIVQNEGLKEGYGLLVLTKLS